MRNKISTFLKGLFIGGSMMVPGVSGGTMAMLLGIYDDLIYSITSVTKFKFKKLPFLIVFVLGALAGFVILAKPMEKLLELYPKPTLYFFIGAVVGGIPVMFKEANVKKVSVSAIAYVLIGVGIVMSLRLLPPNLLNVDLNAGISGYIILFVAGIFISVALILPGISTSFMLLALGIYQDTIKAVSSLYLPFLIPLGLGGVSGILLTTGILEKAMKRFPTPTYLIIIGFVFGSVMEIKPGIPTGVEIPLCIILFAVAAFVLNRIAKVETN